MIIRNLAFLLTLACPAAALAASLDLRNAAVILPAGASPQQQKAADTLVQEVEKRSQLRWEISRVLESGKPSIILARNDQIAALAPNLDGRLIPAPPAAEGFRVQVLDGNVAVVGNDDRGGLFGVGYLLRQMRMRRGRVVDVSDSLSVSTSPKRPIRGHQLGYRPKTNSYDAFSVEMWEQYIRDLAIFGMNAVELIPPRSDDDDLSPHLPLPKIDMMVEMSRILDDYGLDVWIWYPALDKDYSDPATVEFALREWAEVFRKLPRIDHVFVPGGDPGHTQPQYLMALLEKQAASLRKYHPKAGMWVSPQGFTQDWMEEFYAILKGEPEWLTGIVFGPQERDNIPKLRERVPKKYPIRRYPDITHSRQSQYFVPDWDLAYQVTEAREGINPRPRDQVDIFHAYKDYSIGFITYSEGINDDVNKFVWSGLGWDPDAEVVSILRDYSRYFIGPEYTDSFAQGLLALEQNWRGPLLTNFGVATTLHIFQEMEREASPQTKMNWRFQQALYRAYYDAFVRERLLFETALEEQALSWLRRAERVTSKTALAKAEEILDRAVSEPAAEDLRARLFELGEALYQSSRMQLSVKKYQAIRVSRGANLDTTDMPLNNRWWLKEKFAEIRTMRDEQERLEAIHNIVNWTNPGPGGFYDDLGNLARQPHLVRGPGYPSDPAFLESSYVGLGREGHGPNNLRTGYERNNYPISWWRVGAALNETPLLMRYQDLDSEAEYRLRVVYAGGSPEPKLRLVADEQFEIHDWLKRPVPFKPLEFDIPQAANADGKLELRFEREPGLGGNGRGLEVAEVWLMKK